jgi:hypothetical protein
MSIASLASAEIQRVEGQGLTDRSVENLVERAVQLGADHNIAPEHIRPLLLNTFRAAPASQSTTLGAGVPATSTSNALQVLVKYIPTESATLYLAAASASKALSTTISFFTPLFSYWFFAVLTPILLLLAVFAGRRALKLPSVVPPVAQWPWWKMFASFVAFLAWGLAVPTNPFSTSPLQGAAFAFFAVFVSTLLSILEGVFEPQPVAAAS